ncbi:hypothetical protein Pint_18535 [Pistacia integerrima]|uniref:Uncharacterized protein n=1 Tax=Pistacia integerrima TaxID=434235 RepID=A0ACC0YZY3_9ROSI|nr:hypothetical protein Pint_18535 [Pistacia integerrima]
MVVFITVVPRARVVVYFMPCHPSASLFLSFPLSFFFCSMLVIIYYASLAYCRPALHVIYHRLWQKFLELKTTICIICYNLNLLAFLCFLYFSCAANATDAFTSSMFTQIFEIAKHIFCKVCGITSFYIPSGNPDKVAITFRCVDPGTLSHVEMKPYDGNNWGT